MSNEERDKNLPPESSSESGNPPSGGSSWPTEDAPGAQYHPEEQLGEELGDTADAVTRELRELQDELIPPVPVSPAGAPVQPPVTAPEEPSVTVLPTGEDPAVPLEEPGGAPPVTPTAIGAASGPSWQAGGARAGSERSWTANTTADPSATDDDRLLSMLAWLSLVILQLPVVSIIQLLSNETKQRPFQRHHAITSLLFFGAGIVYEVLATIVFTILTTVTLGCGAFCLWVIFFVPHALALYYAFQAYGGKRIELPYLSAYARRQGWL